MATTRGNSRGRHWSAPILVAAAVGLVVGPLVGWWTAAPTITAIVGAFVAWGWWNRPSLAVATALVTGASATTTIFSLTSGHSDNADGLTGAMTLAEIAVLLILVGVVVRHAPARRAIPSAVAGGLVASTATLRLYLPTTVLEAAGQCAFFAIGAVVAAVAGGHLRAVELRGLRSLEDARRAQRLGLARDLHDFVAHDVSGMVALSQAAQTIAADRPDQVAPLLARIEAAGLEALRSMDRTVQMLDQPEGDQRGPRLPARGLQDVADVVDRFRAAGTAEVSLFVDGTVLRLSQIPREVGDTVYRVVVEALTNVRRHAPGTYLVTVDMVAPPPPENGTRAITVSVSNTGPSTAPSGPRLERDVAGGTGLTGLTHRVAALGGTLRYGPRNGLAWQVEAVLPVE